MEDIKREMDFVKTKVQRAEGLLTSLNEEQTRWSDASKLFVEQTNTLLGDALLGASFVTYSGIFDYRTRQLLWDAWMDALESLRIPFNSELSPSSFLCRPAERLSWHAMGLPSDQLCTENAIILHRFNRFPLIVDPSGQAIHFLMNKYRDRKVMRSSFLDASFFKSLASCIRFGTPLIVQDVESIDPILNPVLNREFQRTGGRTIIRLGNEDIDYSPQFVMLMVTRNPAAVFAPDIYSRVTLVNFTVTPASLHSQALGMVLASERPDVERRRNEVLRIQEEQYVRLRELEDALLNELSSAQGNILDDDRVINVLERLKVRRPWLACLID
jgi:dynein heavy chain 1